MLDYNSWQEAQAKVEPLRKQVMEAILKDERFNASIPDAYRDNLLRVDIKNTIFDLIFDLGNFHREIPNTRRALKDLIKDCKRVLKLKVNDK
ncbi:hypothetical protein GZ693_001710 [Campylobacter coli]|nr:hypothetical protein [Campylobacter coli]EAI4223524.1 hypothetical protein [Campylobacter coli]EAI7846455.1 hypothetical protein [Campylobacter coli]EAK4059793.1 hypothetical protein [Campylobacter coli]EAL0868193.1 hypothetical protein [Campylobacter coli]